MAAILRNSTIVVVAAAVVRTRPRAIPLAMITMRKSTHGFPFVSHIWVAYGAPLGSPLGRRSSANMLRAFDHICMEKVRYKFLIIIIIIILSDQFFLTSFLAKSLYWEPLVSDHLKPLVGNHNHFKS